jgi:DNA-binding NarL/FixJ family response regulator
VNTLLVGNCSNGLRERLTRLAANQRFALDEADGEGSALRLLEGPTRYVATIVAQCLRDGDGLHVVECLRLLPHRVSLPIAFVMADRDVGLGLRALRAGATEVFDHTEGDSLIDFVVEWADLSNQASLNGRVLLVEDASGDARYVAHLCQVVGLEVDRTADIESAVRLLASRDYQLSIVDDVLDGAKSGLALVRHIRQEMLSRLPVLMMCGFDDVPRRLMALKNGADDLLNKPFVTEEFIWRVRRLMHWAAQEDLGENGGSPASAQQGPGEMLEFSLSPREKQICRFLLKGQSDKEIAAELNISFWTVRSHVQHIFAKTGVFNRRELMARFISRGK